MTTQTKDYKGMAMEGPIANWYAKNAVRGREAEFEQAAQAITQGLPAGGAVLEVAPGPGYLSILLARQGYQVTGLDISRTFVEIERQNAAQAGVSVDFHLGSASQMPFADASFDRIVCQAAFKNFTRPLEAINEMHRVLRPGGFAIIFDMNADTTNAELDREAGLMHGWLNTLMTRYTFRMLRKQSYSPASFKALVARSKFGACTIQPDGIGLAVWLRK